jgi:looped-hinge helix DNA binding domain, AbrB family
MRSLGIIRKIDILGRIALPVSLRKKMDISENKMMEIYIEDGFVILKEYKRSCIFCGSEEEVTEYKGYAVCRQCRKI